MTYQNNNARFRFRSFGGKSPEPEALRTELEEIVEYFEGRERQLVEQLNDEADRYNQIIADLIARVEALESAP